MCVRGSCHPCAWLTHAHVPACPRPRLLLVGGADSLNRRLDDCWLFDLERRGLLHSFDGDLAA